MPFAIRPVERSDASAVVALVATVLGEFGIAFGEGSPTDAQLQSLPGSYTEGGGAFWIAFDVDSGALVGTCGVYPLGVNLELRKMYLLPSLRGAGLGQALLDCALAWAAQRPQYGALVLDTTDEMLGAIKFYEKNGFVRDDRFITSPRCTRGYIRAL